MESIRTKAKMKTDELYEQAKRMIDENKFRKKNYSVRRRDAKGITFLSKKKDGFTGCFFL